jgi:hypothetical protein
MRRLATLAWVLPALAIPAIVPQGAEASPRSEVRNAFAVLVDDTRALPAKSRPVEKSLLRAAKRARRVALRRPCRARVLMRGYTRGLRRLKRRGPTTTRRLRRRPELSTRGTLEAGALAVDAALLSHPRARRCGGAARPAAARPEATVLSSSERSLTMRVTLPQAHFVGRRFAGRDWTQLAMDGMSTGGEQGSADEGKPGVPMLLEQFGIPTGADVSVQASNVSSYTLRGVNLLPTQPQPVDQSGDEQRPPRGIFIDKPFEIDRAAYRSRAAFPASVADVGPSGQMRDLRVGGSELAGAQYRPRRKTLRVITGMDVQVTFGGDNKGTFADARLTDPFNATFNRIYDSALINWDTIKGRPGGLVPQFCGEEVLIVTSSDLRPAAETLRTQKQAEGFVTRIFEVGAGPGQIGTTNTQIQSFIRGELDDDCWIRPSYVILVGNTAHVPTFLVPCWPGPDAPPIEGEDSCNIASDLPYSLQDASDFFADTALGRIPAPDLATANTVVGKIVGYETTMPAPEGDDFYRHMTVTAFFEHSEHCVLNEGQSGTPNCNPEAGPVNGHIEVNTGQRRDSRTFTQVSEQVRNAMRARGYTVDRLYHARDDVFPEEFWDGTPMPAAIRKPGFAWDADTDEFVNAFNDGRSIILHRDHGNPYGWYDPTITEAQLSSLNNGTQLPVAFGINCAGTRFDEPGDPSFGEGLLHEPDGGAVGVFGDSRNSASWPNSDLTRGFFDALFPNLRPSYGADEPIRRMGDVLVSGKQYLHTVDPGATYGHGHLYGYFGDPTMQLWIAEPQIFDPSRIKAEIRREPFPFTIPPYPGPDPPPFWVNVELTQPAVEGTLVTLFQQDVPVGRGVVQNGRAAILPYSRQFQGGPGMTVALQNESFFAAQDAVEGK